MWEVAGEEDVSGQLLQQAASKKTLQPPSETRWMARVHSLSATITNYLKIYESLLKNEGTSSGDAKLKACGDRRMLEDPEFIIAIVVAQYVLSFFKPLTLFLQKTNCDMVIAFDETRSTLNTLKRLRMDEKFSQLIARAQIIADTMEVVLHPMRRVGRQVHRDNPNVNSAEQIMRTTMYFAFLDHVNNELADFLLISGKCC